MKKRLDLINKRIRQAAEACGRDIAAVKLVTVSKTIAPEVVREAIEAGVTVLGENYVQEAVKKEDTPKKSSPNKDA